MQQLGTGCIELVQDAGSLQLNPTAGIARRDLGVHARKVLENVRNTFRVLRLIVNPNKLTVTFFAWFQMSIVQIKSDGCYCWVYRVRCKSICFSILQLFNFPSKDQLKSVWFY